MSNSISTDTFIKYKSLRESLDTHPSLNNSDKKYVIELASNLLKKGTINTDKYYYFLLYSNKNTNTGRFCLTYHKYLIDTIKEKNTNMLNDWILNFKEDSFFELYGNKLLDDTEKAVIKQMLDIEYAILKQTIEYIIANELISVDIFNGDIYNGNFNKLLETNKLNYIYIEIPPHIYVSELEPINNTSVKKLYIFDFMELLFILTEKNYNPTTKIEFSLITYTQLTDKYAKEIKMIKRYFKNIGKT
jgi:hypothetical protein